MDKYVREALSDKEVMKLVNHRARVVIYRNLRHVDDIHELLGQYGSCFLFFDSGNKIGHWCCLFVRGDTIEFFNSYGGFPDDTLDSRSFGNVMGQDYPYLTRLLLRSGYNIEYNPYRFQGDDHSISTCGRHAAVRLLFKYLDIDEYKRMIDVLCEITGMDADHVVTAITLAINHRAF